MLRYAGWLEDAVSGDGDSRHDVVVAIKADHRLTETQKQALLSVYNNFVETGDEAPTQ